MRPYFPKAGRIDSAWSRPTGRVTPGDRVTMQLRTEKWTGDILYLVRGNGGKGRPVACVLWENGTSTMEPLGRLKKVKV